MDLGIDDPGYGNRLFDARRGRKQPKRKCVDFNSPLMHHLHQVPWGISPWLPACVDSSQGCSGARGRCALWPGGQREPAHAECKCVGEISPRRDLEQREARHKSTRRLPARSWLGLGQRPLPLRWGGQKAGSVGVSREPAAGETCGSALDSCSARGQERKREQERERARERVHACTRKPGPA